MRWFLAALLLLPVNAAAQCVPDQIETSTARVYNSPGDLMTWCATARITSVTFTDSGFPTRFDKQDGPGRWPDAVTPGWDGPLQFTLGMCLRAKNGDGRWDCSAVVQMWYGREDADPNSTTAPYAVASNWFYDGRWGPLQDRNPAPGELVGIFVCRGDCRGNTPPVHERSNVALVTWGTTYVAPVEPPPPPPVPAPVPVPVPAPVPVPQPVPQPLPVPTLDLSGVLLRLDALSLQLSHVDDHLTQHDTDPSWVKKVLTDSKTYMAIIAAVSGYLVKGATQ